MKFYLEFNVKVDEMLNKAKMQDGLVWYYTRWWLETYDPVR